MYNAGHVPTSDPLIGMMDQFQAMAERNFLKDGSLCPVLFVSGDDGVKIIGIPEFGDPKVKPKILASIQMAIIDRKIKEFIILIEAWMAHGQEGIDHYKDNPSLENYDKKEEVIMMLYSSPEAEIMRTAKINREGEKATLSDWKQLNSDKHQEITAMVGGRFNALWQKGTANQN